jgi:hypothetical protein
VISPRLYHARHKREISSSLEEDNSNSSSSSSNNNLHLSHLTVAFTLGERDVVLDLQLNRDLLPQGYFEKYHHKVRSKCSGMLCKYG